MTEACCPASFLFVTFTTVKSGPTTVALAPLQSSPSESKYLLWAIVKHLPFIFFWAQHQSGMRVPVWCPRLPDACQRYPSRKYLLNICAHRSFGESRLGALFVGETATPHHSLLGRALPAIKGGNSSGCLSYSLQLVLQYHSVISMHGAK